MRTLLAICVVACVVGHSFNAPDDRADVTAEIARLDAEIVSLQQQLGEVQSQMPPTPVAGAKGAYVTAIWGFITKGGNPRLYRAWSNGAFEMYSTSFGGRGGKWRHHD